MIQGFFEKHDRKLLRFLEIMPAVVSFNLILFPIWGSFIVPHYVAYFIIAFDVYWFYKSVNIGFTSVISHFKIRASMVYDWLGDVKRLPDFPKVHHIVVIPNYKEPENVLRRSLDTLAHQDFDPKKFITVVLAMEAREQEAQSKASQLISEYRHKFAHIYATYHPDLPSEVKGKSSNQAWAGKWAKGELIDKLGYDIDFTTISSVDADSQFHPKYFSALTYGFLTNPARHRRFWHGAIWFYNNIWRIPAPVRVINTFHSVWRTAILVRRDLLIQTSVYSMSLKMLDEVGYWDVDVIPEDYRVFFKCFFAFSGKVEVEPIFLPIYVDAAESTTYIKTLKNQYEQMKRWAWGVSDDPLIIKWWLTAKNVPLAAKTVHLFNVLLDHFLWPVNWFIITFGANIPVLLNPVFAQTVLGQNLPRISFGILTACGIFLIAILWVDFRQRPKPDPELKMGRFRRFLTLFEFLLMPITGFFFSALPGLDAHTRLMLGKYIEYKVTEKV